MNSKNTYLDKILTLPSKKIINQWFRTIFLFTIIFIPIVFFSLFIKKIIKKIISNKYIIIAINKNNTLKGAPKTPI